MPPVLLVEDDEAGRAMLSEVLSMNGYPVIEAAGYQEALRQAAEHSISIAIVDLRLPDGSGMDLMLELSGSQPDVIMIVSTAHGSLQTAVEAIERGAYAYLLKPYEPESLLTALRHAKEKWRLEHLNRLLLRQSRSETERVRALLQASEEINAAVLETSEIMRRVVRTAVQIMAARSGFVGLKDNHHIRIDEWWDGRSWHAANWQVREGDAAPGYVWQTLSTYRSQEVATDPVLAPHINRAIGQKTMICCPILSRNGEFLGVLDLCDKNGGEPFTDDDVLFLEGMCRNVAIALENNRLYEEHRKNEEQRKQFYRDVVSAATRNKLLLCEADEVDTPTEPPLLSMHVAEAQDISKVRSAISELPPVREMEEGRRDHLLLCVGEATTNALKHGCGGDVLLWLIENGELLIRVKDYGPGIDATTLPRATLQAGYSTKASLGMGLTIIIEFVNRVFLVTGPEGTQLDMQISIEPQEPDPLDDFSFLPDF